LLAYSSIENVGIILIGIGCTLFSRATVSPNLATPGFDSPRFSIPSTMPFSRACYSWTTGSVVNATGTRDIEKDGGLIKVMPYTGVLFLVGSAALAALPPFQWFCQ